jgi:hypothetical protein
LFRCYCGVGEHQTFDRLNFVLRAHAAFVSPPCGLILEKQLWARSKNVVIMVILARRVRDNTFFT